jgi:transcriptional/translational regulatory protein YebC/TACO1
VDVSDIESEDGMITVFAPNTEYGKAKQSLLEAFPDLEFEVDEIQYLAQNTAPLTSPEDAEMFENLLDSLNDNDDVQNVYHSAEV